MSEDIDIQDLMKNNRRPTPKFFLEFNSFAIFGTRVEASFAVTPEYEIEAVLDTYIGEGKVRVLTLIFHEANPQPRRRGFSLHKEWEISKEGEITLDSPVPNKKVKE